MDAGALGRLAVGLAFVGAAFWAVSRISRKSGLRWLWGFLAGLVAALGGVVLLVVGSPTQVVATVPPQRALVPAEGLRLVPGEPTLVRLAETGFRSDPSLGPDITAFEMRGLLRGGEAMGSVAVLSIDPAAASDPTLERNYVAGAARERHGPLTEVTLSGESTFRFTSTVAGAGELTWYVWQHENLLLSLNAIDPKAARAQAEAMIDALT